MLPEFRVPVILGEAGARQQHALLVQDVPTCVFWQGYPDPAAPPREQAQTQADWFRHVLLRATVQPTLSIEWILSWGNDYWPPTVRYLEAIGFAPRPIVAAAEASEILDLAAAAPPRAPLADHAAFRGAMPAPHVRFLIRHVARATGIRAAQLWRMPASEFFFTYHVHLTDEEKVIQPLPTLNREAA